MSSTPHLHLTRTAWLIVALLWPVALLNYLDRQMVASMKSSVMNDIPSIERDENWGYMLGQFKWAYAILSPLGGYVADRFGRRYTIAGSLVVWSGVTWATGQATTYHELLWTRTLMGISEAFYIPAALALIADYHSGRTRSRAIGLHQTAIYCGVIAGGFSGHVADDPDLGWRFAFDLVGLVGIVYAVPLMLLLRDAPRSPGAANADARSPRRSRRSWHLPPTSRSSCWFCTSRCRRSPAGLSAIGCRRFSRSTSTSARARPVCRRRSTVSVAALFGAMLGGWLADRAMRHTIRGRIFTSALGMAMLIPALFGIGNAATLGIAIAFLILFGLGWGFFDCNNMPILAQITRPELRATGYGVMNFVSISCGGFADWGFGILRDRHVPDNVIFSAFASLCLISIVLVLLIRPRLRSATAGELP